MTGRNLKTLPNFFILGVPKSGTTSLYRYLGEHPDVFMTADKETYFFDQIWDEHENDPKALEKHWAAYLSRFDDAGSAPIRGEGSPDYFHHPKVSDRIHSRIENPRFVVLLRDPIERAWSNYLMNRRNGHTTQSFMEKIEQELGNDDNNPKPGNYVYPGLYATHLQRWQDTFGEDKIRAFLLTDLRDRPLHVLETIARFTNIDPEPMAHVDYQRRHNPHREPRNAASRWLLNTERVRTLARTLLPLQARIWLGERFLSKPKTKPTMDQHARQRLAEVYSDQINRLETMLNRDVSSLQASWP